MKRILLIVACLSLAGFSSSSTEADDRNVSVRVESLTIPPGHLPMLMVELTAFPKNVCEGTLRVEVPEGWRLAESEKQVERFSGIVRVGFKLEKALNLEANRYPIKATFTDANSGETYSVEQEVQAASAPYFKPVIDGKTDDWKDAVAVSFDTEADDNSSKKTTVRTFWNRRTFSILVEVEEDEVAPFGAKHPDAIQIAFAAADATTPYVGPALSTKVYTMQDSPLQRCEYLIMPIEGGGAKVGILALPGVMGSEVIKPRELTSLKVDPSAKVAVSREGGITRYECSFPWTPMRNIIRPCEGREFSLGLLVHDGDAGEIRQWSKVCGVRGVCGVYGDPQAAWSRWEGMIEDAVLLDSKTKWGMCSSKY